jgi:hypothetical protein
MITSLRIHKSANSAGGFDDYLQRLVKLVPAEIIGLYLTLKGFYNRKPDDWMIWFVPPLCLILLIIVRIFATKRQWIAVAVSSVSFGIWLGATGDPLVSHAFSDGRIWSVLVLVWTFIVPWFYKGD